VVVYARSKISKMMNTMSNVSVTPRGVENDNPAVENCIQHDMCSFPTLAFSKFDINRVPPPHVLKYVTSDSQAAAMRIVPAIKMHNDFE